MHPVTLRRLIVFGVCAVGVACLYLTPDVTRAPQQGSVPRPVDKPTSSPSRSATASAARSSSTARSVSATSTPTVVVTTASAPAPAPTEEAVPRPAPSRRPTARGATAFDPTDGDDTPPAPVTDVSSDAVTPEKLTLHWPAAEDDVGVTGYRVLLNGYPVATTALTHATVRWFNDDASENVVQVRALDAAGNESPASPPLLVARPTPAPTPSTTPGPSTSPEPVPTSTPQPTPSSPSPEPDDDGAGTSDTQPGQEPPVNQTAPRPDPAPAPSAR